MTRSQTLGINQCSHSLTTHRLTEPIDIGGFSESICCNCKREQFDFNTNSKYHIVFHEVGSEYIKSFGHKCQFVRRHSAEASKRAYNLCTECRSHLVDCDTSFSNLWHGYFWSIFLGYHSPKFSKRLIISMVYILENIFGKLCHHQ